MGPTFECAVGKLAAAVLGAIWCRKERAGKTKTGPTQPGWTIGLWGKPRGREDVDCNVFLLHLVLMLSITCKGDLYRENSAKGRLGVQDFYCLG
jgi:hypothetical protein